VTHQTEVLIIGAGPAGLLLACELRLAGIDTTLVERHPERPDFCRGFNLNARALDLLARRGLAERFIAEGWQVPHAPFTSLPVTLSLEGAATDHPYSLGIPQIRVEEILEETALARGTTLLRGHELRELRQSPTTVTATIAGPDGEYRIEAAYVVGCDGGRSTVRKQAGIAFPGTAAKLHMLLGDVELADPVALPPGNHPGPAANVFVIPRPGYVRVLVADPDPPANQDRDEPVSLPRFQAVLDTTLGRDVEIRRARWLTRFGDAARQAEEYVRGRIILAGDAAHIHPPAGAIGVNVALDDAFNLGWKLAATVRGTAPAHLLASYHTERHAVGERLLASTRAQVALTELAEQGAPLAELLTRVARHPGGNRAFAETLIGLDTTYEMYPHAEQSHPWLGRLAPDLRLNGDGGRRLTGLLESGRAVLVDFTEQQRFRLLAAKWAGRVNAVSARSSEHPELRALLIRPDGHTAWVAHIDDNPVDKSVNNLVDNPGDNPADSFVDNRVDNLADNLADNRGDKSVDSFVDNRGDDPGDSFVDNPADNPDNNNVDTLVDNLVDNVDELERALRHWLGSPA
jgi:2-polyprenyl-6-methoxyphenol hydroxylase-like FAD-dependent oxidoreductase